MSKKRLLIGLLVAFIVLGAGGTLLLQAAQLEQGISIIFPFMHTSTTASNEVPVPIKPTFTPTVIPTITPIPTPLPLPEVAFNALWADSLPEAAGSTIWAADPRNIGSRYEIFTIDNQAVYQLAASSNGEKIAFTAAGYGASTSPLWLVDADGNNLEQLDSNASQLLWTQDNRGIVYDSVTPTGDGFIGYVDVPSRMITNLVTTTSESLLTTLLGWSESGESVYYVVQVSREQGYAFDLYEVGLGTRTISKITTLEEFAYPLLSSNGQYLLHNYGTSEGIAIFDIHQKATRFIQLSGQGHMIWGATGQELLILDSIQGALTLRSLNIFNMATDEQTFVFPTAPTGLWDLRATSPDGEWLIAAHSEKGYYWLNPESGLVIPVPCGGRCTFSWLRN